MDACAQLQLILDGKKYLYPAWEIAWYYFVANSDTVALLGDFISAFLSRMPESFLEKMLTKFRSCFMLVVDDISSEEPFMHDGYTYSCVGFDEGWQKKAQKDVQL